MSTAVDERAPIAEVYRLLATSELGLTQEVADARLLRYGPNQLTRTGRRRWPGELLKQFTQPLAILLMAAAALAWIGGTPALSLAVIAVIVLNAAFAFAQEMQAERAVEALAAFLAATVRVVRDGAATDVPASQVVPGDVVVVVEGNRICADSRIIDGELLLDLSALTGESAPATRSTRGSDPAAPLLEAHDMIFSGTTCTGGEARTVVTRTGMTTELGRIASLSEQGTTEPSPLEKQVRRATWIIAVVAVVVGAAFLPIGLAAGLGWSAAISFSIGLLVANVPEGLLPTITLALAVGVRELAHRGAVVKRLSAVETLGSTTVICTDKTGTLTQNRMEVTELWQLGAHGATLTDPRAELLITTAATCTSADAPTAAQPTGTGDPTELALLRLASDRHLGLTAADRRGARTRVYRFDSGLKRMSTEDRDGSALVVSTKGALESVAPCCTDILSADGQLHPLDAERRQQIDRAMDGYAARGLRVLAVARRVLDSADPEPADRDHAESQLTLLGLIAMVDPPRAGVSAAVAAAHRAGVRIHVVTGDYGLTAAAVARSVGIGAKDAAPHVITGRDLDRLDDKALDTALAGPDEIVFARTSPESKLRICQALRARGDVVAMTGDGVNDAPALRHADIGIAMGRSGTDVAREAATMVLTDDNFATIVSAIDAGRRVFDNVRKFVLYIFAHAVPEVVPFLVFAISGGAIPLPLTVLQILAIDLGTETLPALALGREPAEPGLMERPPRPRAVGVIDRALLVRAWVLLGGVSAVLAMGGFLFTLSRAGWHSGDPTGRGTLLHHAYLQATTVTFLGIVACQLGTAFAARTDRSSLFTIGVRSNPLLLWGILFELCFSAALIYAPPIQHVFGTAALSPAQLLVVLPFPFIVWGADELVRWLRRHRAAPA